MIFLSKKIGKKKRIMIKTSLKHLRRLNAICAYQRLRDESRQLTFQAARPFSKTYNSINAQKWISIDSKLDLSRTVRVMTYNILAESNIVPEFYPNVQHLHLLWETRLPLLIKLAFLQINAVYRFLLEKLKLIPLISSAFKSLKYTPSP